MKISLRFNENSEEFLRIELAINREFKTYSSYYYFSSNAEDWFKINGIDAYYTFNVYEPWKDRVFHFRTEDAYIKCIFLVT